MTDGRPMTMIGCGLYAKHEGCVGIGMTDGRPMTMTGLGLHTSLDGCMGYWPELLLELEPFC